MLKKYKDFSGVIVKCDDYKQVELLENYLEKNGFTKWSCSLLDAKKIIHIDLKNKRFIRCSKLSVEVHDDCFISCAIIQFKDLEITLGMKKKMYLTPNQLRCFDYVEEIEEYELIDLYTDDFGVVVKAKHINTGDIVEDNFADFFETIICRTIEDNFDYLMKCDWDSLDKEYEMLKLSRECMKELF